MTFKNFTNEVLKSNRIFSREDIGKMSSNDFRQNEKAIDYQMQKIGTPSNDDLSNSSDVVYVSSYTRADGTDVSAHYRSKPDKNGSIFNKPTDGGIVPPSEENGSIFGPNNEDLKMFISSALKQIFPDNQNIDTITQLINDGLSLIDGTVDSPEEDSEAHIKKMRENILKVVSQVLPESKETLAFVENLNKHVFENLIPRDITDGGIVAPSEENGSIFGPNNEDLKMFISSALKQIFPDNQNIDTIIQVITDALPLIDGTVDSPEEDSEAHIKKYEKIF